MQRSFPPPIKKWLTLTAVLLLVVGCQQAPTASVDLGPRAAQFAQLVETLASPEMQGRGAGTQGLDKARDVIAQRFQQAGLEPAFGESYVQGFHVPMGVTVQQQALRVGEAPLEPGEGFVPLGFSGSGEFQGEAVFVGYGIDRGDRYDSFDGADLSGKVAVAFRFEPMDDKGRSLWGEGRWTRAAGLVNKAQWAANHGAVALLVVNPPRQDEAGLKQTKQSVAEQVAPIPVIQVHRDGFATLLNEADRDAALATEAYQKRADAGTLAPDALGVNVRGVVELERPQATAHNVAAVLPGEGELASQVIVIGAHYDHLGMGEVGSLAPPEVRGHAIHHGADDNASGTAVLLMLAEAMAERAQQDNAPELRRTLVFVAFSGEERGLLGSRHFFEHLKQANLAPKRINAMVNFDMVGRMRKRQLMVFSTNTHPHWEQLLRPAARAAGVKLETDQRPAGVSDDAVFRRAGVPAVHFFTGFHEDYHRPTDVADNLNPTGGARVFETARRLLRALWVVEF